MPRMPNVVEIDATAIDANGLVVPRDLTNDDVVEVPKGYDFGEIDAYELSSDSVKSDWAVKVVNDADEAVDVVPAVTTSDDHGLDAYAEDDSAETAATGTSPDNVAYFSSGTVAGYLGAVLTADPAPTAGTVTVVFNARLYGGA